MVTFIFGIGMGLCIAIAASATVHWNTGPSPGDEVPPDAFERPLLEAFGWSSPGL